MGIFRGFTFWRFFEDSWRDDFLAPASPDLPRFCQESLETDLGIELSSTRALSTSIFSQFRWKYVKLGPLFGSPRKQHRISLLIVKENPVLFSTLCETPEDFPCFCCFFCDCPW